MDKPIHGSTQAGWGARAHRQVERVLLLLSAYAVPAAVLAVSAIALVFWQNTYQVESPVRLEFRAFLDHTGQMTRDDAIRVLTRAPDTVQFATKRSSDPVWFTLSPHQLGLPLDVIEIPSRHLAQMQCWRISNGELLGSGDRLSKAQSIDGDFLASKVGYAFPWNPATGQVICRGLFVGPAMLNIVTWSTKAYDISVRQFHRQSALFEAGMLTLAFFVLVMSIINRQKMYLLFAVWLVLGMRTAEISAGSDIRWLGYVIPGDFLLVSRSLTVTLFGIVSCLLFGIMFKRELAGTATARIHSTVMWASLPMLFLAVALPYGVYLPFLWVATAGYGMVMFHGLWKVRLWHANSGRIVIAAFAVVLASSMAEVIAGAFGVPGLLTVLNSVTGAMASSLLASFAIAEQMRVETSARIAAQQRLSDAFEAMPAGMFTLDAEGVFVAWNPALERMLGRMEGGCQRWSDHFGLEGWSRLQVDVASGQADFHLRHVRDDRDYSVRATSANGCIEGSIKDVTDRVAAIEQLDFMASHDPLTRTFNGRGIAMAFEAASERQNEGAPLSLAYMNLHQFKTVNDTAGHEAGDEVLRQVSMRASKMLKDGHAIGRLGGDEFVIVMADTHLSVAELIARSISQMVRQEPYLVGTRYVSVSCSIGLVEVVPGTDFDEATALANNACQRAKKMRHGGIVLYERAAAESRKVQMEMDLAARVSAPDLTQTLSLRFRRVRAIDQSGDGPILLAELALKDNLWSDVAAADIVTAARKSGNAAAVDRWQLSTALAMIQSQGLVTDSGTVLLALSGASLNDMQFLNEVVPLLQVWPHAARRLCLEIGESAAFGDLMHMRAFVDVVKVAGASVSLAEFGSGHTVLSELRGLPVDLARIDDSVVAKVIEHPSGMAILESLVTLAKSLGLRTAASVPSEQPGVTSMLASVGVDYIVTGEVMAVAESSLPASGARVARSRHLAAS